MSVIQLVVCVMLAVVRLTLAIVHFILHTSVLCLTLLVASYATGSVSDASNWASDTSSCVPKTIGGDPDATGSVSYGSSWACDANGCLLHFELMAGRK